MFCSVGSWAYGDISPTTLEIEGGMSSIDAPGLEELESIIIGLVNPTMEK